MRCIMSVILPTWAVLLAFSLPPSADILPTSTSSRRTVNKTSRSNPWQAQNCYIFRVWVIIKALLKQISLYLLSHSRIRIILLICPDDINVILQVCKKSSAEIMRACKITQISMRRGQYYFHWNLRSLSVCSCLCKDLRVPHVNLNLDISMAEDMRCLKAVDSNFVRNGEHITDAYFVAFAVGPVYPNNPLTMCSSDFVFRKYKQDSAFRASGVLQLAKTGPTVTKNVPLLRLFLSDLIMAWNFYTSYNVNCTNKGITWLFERILFMPQMTLRGRK